MSEENKPEKSKSFKNLEDLLNIEADGGSFDETQALKEAEALEAKKKKLEADKNDIKSLEGITDINEYMVTAQKMLIKKSMTMLSSLQLEIEDAPTGRDLETAAAMVSSINGVVEGINKIKTDAAKLSLEQEKLSLKKEGLKNGSDTGGNIGTVNNNLMMVCSTSDLMDALINQGIIQGNKPLKPVESEVQKEKTINIETENANKIL